MRAARVLAAVFFLGLPSAALKADGLDAVAGKALFERQWIPAPSSTDTSDGLGPLFNARSCATCHAGGGGARVVKDADGTRRLSGGVVRLGTAAGAVDPYYGLQLQTDAVPGLKPEALISVLPKLKASLLGPPLSPGIAMSVRLAPSLFGAAELARISDSEILSRADPDDTNSDGISGRARQTPDGIGRFGWKAAHATLAGQIANAFAIDIGLSSPVEPLPYGDCTLAETDCRAAANGESALTDNREVSMVMLNLIAEYLKKLAPAAGAANAGNERIFDRTGCAACHVPALKASDGSLVSAFTDLLLHDMGSDLDDGVGEAGVSSAEWRTAPLKKTYPRGGERRYLHDGSAATIEDAISKHGGEAAASRRAFNKLRDDDKARLVKYVSDLK